MPQLDNKTFVIVGGTTGLGLSAARAFVATGAKVVVVGRNSENVEAATASLGQAGRGLAGDATQPQTAVEAIDLAKREFGGFDGMYHVAGGSGRQMGDGPLHEVTDEGWAKTIELNLTSVFHSNRAALQAFDDLGIADKVPTSLEVAAATILNQALKSAGQKAMDSEDRAQHEKKVVASREA